MKTTQVATESIYQARDAVDNLNTFIKIYFKAVESCDVKGFAKLPEPQCVAQLLAVLSEDALTKIEIINRAI